MDILKLFKISLVPVTIITY